MFGALVFVLAQASAGAWSNGRPPECTDAGGHADNVWERAKAPELRRYCDLVASASSKLAGIAAMAQAALQAAREADVTLPGHAAPLALEGRALAGLGKYADALSVLTEARQRDPRSLEDPPALLAWARSLARAKKQDAATEAYRALLPRATVLPTHDRVSAEIEAALVAMERGAPGLDEATASLREALREAQEEALAVAVLALALALDREGNSNESRALLGERARGDPRDAVASSRAKELLAVAPGETRALTGLALESSDPVGARDEWQAAIDAAPTGPWAKHARAHLAALAGRRTEAVGGKR